jgi:hypothetical protein
MVQSGGGFAPIKTHGVKLTHKPTGIVVQCSSERSQHRNREQALRDLERYLHEAHPQPTPPAQPAPVQPVAHTYASTQATMCACCGEHKHTPLRIDKMGGYVCLTCIDKKLGSLLGEFGHPPAQPAVQEPIGYVKLIDTPFGEKLKPVLTIAVPVGSKLYTTPPAAQPAVPDAIHHTDLSEHPQYIEGWNDCRAEMLKGMKP